MFSKLRGVVHVTSGYTGGTSENPTYHAIGDHAEAIEVEFNPHAINYKQLLDEFWRLHDPTAEYEDRFRSAIFYLDETQRQLAKDSRSAVQKHFNQPIATEILPAGKFYPAESHNQDYLARLDGEI